MRIAIVTESYKPAANSVTASISRLLPELAALGHDAIIVAPGRGPMTSAGFPVVRMPAGPAVYRSLPVGLPAVRRVESVLREFDPEVVHVVAPVALGAAGLLAARRLGVPTVAAFHTDLSSLTRHYGAGGCGRSLWAWLRWVHSLADRTLVPSTAALIDLRSRGFPRLTAWNGGIDLEEFAPDRCEVRLRAELGAPGQVLVGYVGRVARDRQVELLPSVAALPGARLVVVGSGPAESWLRRRTPSAAHLGRPDGRDLAGVIASLDVLVSPGADGRLGQCAVQALASGVPVVAAATSVLPGLVRHGDNGLLVAPGSARALALGVGALVRDPQLRSELGARARASVSDRSWPAVTAALVRHLTAASKSPSAHHPERRLAA